MALMSVELGIKPQNSCCNLAASPSGRLRPVSLTKSRRKYCAVVAELKLFEHETSSFEDVETSRLLTTGRLVQWYPGHIAKAERELKDRLQLVDVVIDVRDARIPLSTTHPKVDDWIEGKKRVLALNREDMISTADRNAWAAHFSRQGLSIVFTDARRGKGTMKLMRKACSVASAINAKRKEKGLLPRAVRAAVIGYPNVGKSSLINRLVKRRICIAAPRPGVTRNLKWTTIGDGLDLLDAPGILPMRIDDQEAAVKIAICNDIGEGSYAVAGVAAVLVERLKRMPTGPHALAQRYKFDAEPHSGESFLEELAQILFRGDANQAATRVLNDFRKDFMATCGLCSIETPTGNLCCVVKGGKRCLHEARKGDCDATLTLAVNAECLPA